MGYAKTLTEWLPVAFYGVEFPKFTFGTTGLVGPGRFELPTFSM